MDTFSENFFASEPTAPEIEQIEVTETPDTEVETPTEAIETPEAEPAPVEPKMVPLSAVQAERQKAKEAFEQVNALRQQIASYEANKQQSVIDPYDDPQAFYAQQQQLIAQQVQQAITAQRVSESAARVVAEHGQEYLDEVAEWAQQASLADPTFEARVFAQPDPAKWIIEQKNRSEMFKSFEADPDSYVRQRALELGLAAIEPTIEAPQPMARKPLGPKSLASMKSRDSVSNHPETPADAFDAIFRK